ncbi:unnamed protein product [Gongylonema pulchrum]|uniref:Eukaryotic translation initiation factor 3 subunit p66 n=1 Tax=Gongylonema pulchrum TaxID=637853 RepID=A0A183EA14_9BILA|nr:unnamed protein product [Gongylonema pulchrum]
MLLLQELIDMAILIHRVQLARSMTMCTMRKMQRSSLWTPASHNDQTCKKVDGCVNSSSSIDGSCKKRMSEGFKQIMGKTRRLSEVLRSKLPLINGHRYGQLYYYDKAFDRVTVRTEKPLQRCGGTFYNLTTTEDPIIQKVCFFFI